MLNSYIIQRGYDADHKKTTYVKVHLDHTNAVYSRDSQDEPWSLVENAVIVSPDNVLTQIKDSTPIIFTRFSFSRIALP